LLERRVFRLEEQDGAGKQRVVVGKKGSMLERRSMLKREIDTEKKFDAEKKVAAGKKFDAGDKRLSP